MRTSNKRLHYFNPGHETAIQSGMFYYTPPASVRKMMGDLALLPLWYGNKGDYILIDESVDSSIFLADIPDILRPDLQPVTPATLPFVLSEKHLEAMPWGLSPQTIRYFERFQTDTQQLTIPSWKEIYKQLTARQTAAEYLRLLQKDQPEFQELTPPLFCSEPDEINQFMASYPPPYVLKMPYSCSGRGLYWITERHIDNLAMQWITGAIKRQGSVSIEPAVDKICDFALEFESDGQGTVEYKGLSVFNTLEKGAFSGNLLGTQQILKEQLTKYISENQLQATLKAVKSLLTKYLSNLYKGNFGVDMLLYRTSRQTFAIHPFIELNLRNTMGLVALQISNRLVYPTARGRFVVSYDKKADELHRQMQRKYPLKIKEGKIHSGYFPLCPVSPETNYRAYILI